MPEMTQLLAGLRYSSEQVEREASRAPQATSGALMFGGLLGLAGAAADRRLAPRESVVAAAGSAACFGVGVLALRVPVPLMKPARLAPRIASGGCYLAALISTAGGGGHRSPAYFPAVLMTAVGAGVASSPPLTSAASGAIVASGYLASCSASISATGESPREGWSAASYACGFIGAAVVGAIAGDLTLRARVLSDYAARERDAAERGVGRRDIDLAAGKVRESGRRFLSLLPQVGASFSDVPAVADAAERLATALATLRSADTRLSVEEEHQELGTWKRLEQHLAAYNEDHGDVTVELMLALDAGRSTDAETTGILLDCVTPLVQNAANARNRRPEPVKVIVRVTRERSWLTPGAGTLVMTVEDDAGGSRVPEERWRTGLWSCKELVEEHGGGEFALQQGDAGVRALVRLPFVPSATRGRQARTYSAEYAHGVNIALRTLRGVTAAQAAFLVLYRGRDPLNGLARVALILGLGELAERMPHVPRTLVQSSLCVVAMGAFDGEERPAMGGWSAVMSASASSRGHTPQALIAGALAMAASVSRAGGERFRSGLAVTVVDRAFALLAAGSGAAIWRGQRALQQQEEQLGSEAWRRRLLLELARPGVEDHHFLRPLQDAIEQTSPAAWEQFNSTPLGQQLHQARSNVRATQAKLSDMLRSGDPVQALQDQLAYLLQPAPVSVFGTRPQSVIPEEGKELDAVGYRLALIGLGHEIAKTVRYHLPPTLLGRRRLSELRLDLTPGERLTRIEAIQVPFNASADDRPNAALDAASRATGGRAEVTSKQRHTVYVHNSALS